MTLAEARKVLGLGPGEDPGPHLADFGAAREHIAAMVRAAPTGILADRYQKGLMEFDEALVAIRKHLGLTQEEIAAPAPAPPAPVVVEAAQPKVQAKSIFRNLDDPDPSLVPPVVTESVQEILIPSVPEQLPKPPAHIPPPPPTVKLAEVAAPMTPVTEFASPEAPEEEEAGSRIPAYLAWTLAFAMLAGTAGFWIYKEKQRSEDDRRAVKVAFLERQGSAFIENRNWQEAASAFDEIEKLQPGSEIAARGRRSIETGMDEQQTQFIGYWTGQSIAELEAGNLDKAEENVRKVLTEFPGEKEALSLLDRIGNSRAGQARASTIDSAKQALGQRKWGEAIALIEPLLARNSDDPDAKTIQAEARAGQEKATADQAKARDLLQKAVARDKGEFDQQALEWLREAASLAPEDGEIAARLEKLSSYTRTIRVPGDFETPAEAIASAHDRDRIVLGPGEWKGPLVINSGIELQGSGIGNCRIECPPGEASAITIGPGAKGARVSGISFRHESFAVGTDRYSVALVRGGSVTFADCKFSEASGHGLVIIEGGQASVSRSRFTDNGWNGIAVMGQGSTLEARECEATDNFEHGIESWDGAAVILLNNRCESNSRNGIHADNGLASATMEGNQLLNNREFGLVLSSAGSGKVSGNTARGNLLGGFVIRQAAAKVVTISNQANLNKGPGLVLERGLPLAAYASNSSSQNKGEQVLANTNLTVTETPVAEESKAPRATVVQEPAIKDPPVVPEDP